MTNTGVINLYNIPEIGQIKNGDMLINGQKDELLRLKSKLNGLSDESFALSWNKVRKGLLTSAAQTTICVWDTPKASEPSVVIENAHADSINDVKFGPDGNLLISTADDGHFKIWDLRTDTRKFTMAYKAVSDDGESLCVGQFNPINANVFAVAGSSSGEIQIWDMRMPQSEINSFSYHSSQVTLLEWCPNQENILASGSDDKKIYIWDQAMNGSEQARQDYEDGPPELIFPHEYHTSVIEDIQWIPQSSNYNMSIASIETNHQF